MAACERFIQSREVALSARVAATSGLAVCGGAAAAACGGAVGPGTAFAAAATARDEDLFELLAEAGSNAPPAPPARPRATASASLRDASPEVAATRALRATSRDWRDRLRTARDAAEAAFDDALALTAETEQTRRHSRKTRAAD